MRGRRAGLGVAFALALLLGPALAVAPPLAGVAVAADTLREVASATYVADPENRVVHVAVTESATNLKPNLVSGGVIRQFFYNSLILPIHGEATSVAASDSRGALRVSRAHEDGYDLITIRLRDSLLYQQTIKATLRYDLPGGAPRSDSQIRVGEAFVGLYLYAWGDPGQGSVRLELPAGFEPDVTGDELDRSNANGTIVLSKTAIQEPFSWFSVISANRDARLATSQVVLGGGDTITIRAWPEDAEWQDRVQATLRSGAPLLSELIGLHWPVAGDLVVTEVQSAGLEGYAGIYDTRRDTIRITEELDDLVIVHEVSHAWFNDRLFEGRWIDEGFADEYASLVLDKLALGEHKAPERPIGDAPGRVALNAWAFPGRINDDETANREDYGYNASWYVVRSLVEEVGEDRMRAVLRAADNDQIAYLGDGPPERVSERDAWRRFLDLLDERGGSKLAEQLFRTFVVTDSERGLLDARAAARAEYRELAAAGDGLAPPFVVRDAMATWRFEDADRWIAEASSVLTDRASLEADATTLGVTLPDNVEVAWRAAEDDLAGTHAAVAALETALEDLSAARVELDTPRDVVTSIGLFGSAPESGWTDATSAFEAGDLDAADAATDALDVLLTGAPGSGRARLAGSGVVLGGVLVGGVLMARRRRRAPAGWEGPAGAAAVADTDPTGSPEPSATLPPGPEASAPADPPAPVQPPPTTDQPDAVAEPRLDPAPEA